MRLGLILSGLLLVPLSLPLAFGFAIISGGGHGSPFDGGAAEFAFGVTFLTVPLLILLLGIASLACTNRTRLKIVIGLAAAVPVMFAVAVFLGYLASRPHAHPELITPAPPIGYPTRVTVMGSGKNVSIACNPVNGECIQREQELDILPSNLSVNRESAPKRCRAADAAIVPEWVESGHGLVDPRSGAKLRYMFVIFAFLLSAAASGTEPSRPTWVTVTKDPAAVREKTTLAFGTLGVARQEPLQLAYYAKRTTQRGDEALQVQWADSNSCPALIGALGRLRDLPPPRIDVPGFPNVTGGMNENIVIDGIIYTLKLEGLNFSTNVGSRLADWTETTLRALEPCWRADAPLDVTPRDDT